MYTVGDVTNRHLRGRPARKERLKNAAAHVSMQTADAIHGSAAAQRQVRHIKGLGDVLGILAAERQ